MTLRLAAFLRAVNVGGTGKLPMASLRALAQGAGLENARTYIASGNLVFDAPGTAGRAKAVLEAALGAHMGKAAPVFIRSATEIKAIIAGNPFPAAAGNRLMVILHDGPQQAMIDGARNRTTEELALGPGCIYAHYPTGMGQSKLKLPGAEQGTARNLNTIRAVLDLLHG